MKLIIELPRYNKKIIEEGDFSYNLVIAMHDGSGHIIKGDSIEWLAGDDGRLSVDVGGKLTANMQDAKLIMQRNETDEKFELHYNFSKELNGKDKNIIVFYQNNIIGGVQRKRKDFFNILTNIAGDISTISDVNFLTHANQVIYSHQDRIEKDCHDIKDCRAYRLKILENIFSVKLLHIADNVKNLDGKEKINVFLNADYGCSRFFLEAYPDFFKKEFYLLADFLINDAKKLDKDPEGLISYIKNIDDPLIEFLVLSCGFKKITGVMACLDSLRQPVFDKLLSLMHDGKKSNVYAILSIADNRDLDQLVLGDGRFDSLPRRNVIVRNFVENLPSVSSPEKKETSYYAIPNSSDEKKESKSKSKSGIVSLLVKMRYPKSNGGNKKNESENNKLIASKNQQ